MEGKDHSEIETWAGIWCIMLEISLAHFEWYQLCWESFLLKEQEEVLYNCRKWSHRTPTLLILQNNKHTSFTSYFPQLNWDDQ
jgi:hypothetical protein